MSFYYGKTPIVRGSMITAIMVLCLFLTPEIHAQARVDLVSTVEAPDEVVYSYRIVGASYSDMDRLKRFEKANEEVKKFSSFSYDKTTHICRVGVGEIGGDRDESLIRYYLKQAVGALEGDAEENSREWADDDPRHGSVGDEFPTAIPEPTDPDDMPDWGNLIPANQHSESDGGGQ